VAETVSYNELGTEERTYEICISNGF
jgi:hypothetical protein